MCRVYDAVQMTEDRQSDRAMGFLPSSSLESRVSACVHSLRSINTHANHGGTASQVQQLSCTLRTARRQELGQAAGLTGLQAWCCARERGALLLLRGCAGLGRGAGARLRALAEPGA